VRAGATVGSRVDRATSRAGAGTRLCRPLPTLESRGKKKIGASCLDPLLTPVFFCFVIRDRPAIIWSNSTCPSSPKVALHTATVLTDRQNCCGRAVSGRPGCDGLCQFAQQLQKHGCVRGSSKTGVSGIGHTGLAPRVIGPGALMSSGVGLADADGWLRAAAACGLRVGQSLCRWVARHQSVLTHEMSSRHLLRFPAGSSESMFNG